MSDKTGANPSDRKRCAPSADEVEYLLENDVIDVDTLKQFTIPKKKSHKHDIFTRVEMSSPESRELIRVIHQSFKDRESVDSFVFSRPRIINNTNLMDKFVDRRKQMKQNGYSDKELQEIFAFLYFADDAEAIKVCSEGISTNNMDITCLGDPKMGVYLSKHADIISSKPLKNKMYGTILIVKVIKGRVKIMSECVGGMVLDPSPNFDCHILKSSAMDLSSSSIQQIFECTQLYLYEYMEDSELSDLPSQLLPYALLNFRYERIGRSIPLLSTPSLKQNKVERKSGLQLSEKKTSKNIPGIPTKEVELNRITKCTTMPFNDYQLWSGNVFIAEMPLGFCLLNSSCLFIDSTFLGSDLHIKEKVPLEYMKLTILKDFVSSLDRKKCNYSGGSCVILAYLQPINSNSTFNSFVEHLLQTSMVGYAVLFDCAEIFFVPSDALKECSAWDNSDAEKYPLCCFFVLKNTAYLKIQGHIERKLVVNFSRTNPFFNTEKDQGLSGHLISPEVEQPSAKARDPRLRHKVKSVKPDHDCDIKNNVIIGTSRLLTLFEHMSEAQDKMNVEIARRFNQGAKANLSNYVQVKLENSQQFLAKTDLKINDSSLETCGKVPSNMDLVTIPQSTSLDPTNSLKLSSFKIPETIYATAIADPKVNQLLEELKSKNIIGLGVSPNQEVSSNRTDMTGHGVLKTDNSDTQKRRIDPRIEKMSKDETDLGFSNRTQDPQSQSFSLEIPRDDKFSTIHQTHMMPYSPGDNGGCSPQFPEQRRRYGFLPDPKTFQKNFVDSHQRPRNPYPSKADPRRSKFPPTSPWK